MDNKKPCESYPNQNDKAAMREALQASERESSLYSYPNSFYLAEPTAVPSTSSPYNHQPTPVVESAALNSVPTVANLGHRHQRFPSRLSQAERRKIADAARVHLSSLYVDQSQKSTRPQPDPSDTRTQAKRRQANNPLHPRHNIDRSDPFGSPRVPAPNLGNERYRDTWASQPTDRSPVGKSVAVEYQINRHEAAGVFQGMMSDEEVRAEVERSRRRQLDQESRQLPPGCKDDRMQEGPAYTATPVAPEQRARHGAVHVQAHTKGALRQQQHSVSPLPAQLSSTKKCGMCRHHLHLSMFAKGNGYQTRCAPCREKHNISDKVNAEKRKGEDSRDEAAGHRVCRTCCQRLALQIYFGGKKGSRGEKYYTKCFGCRGEAVMKEEERN